ncbi:MAG: STAS domain-containing protein [Spirochaetaceae bacterium]|nr:STAS domain-containing protein [Spirochaetaceae bacterium]MCF7947157.1 STAS domain-containing protein [Spirochaetia bacterium]MCF7950022.1 STAS domain-containing protein [Spirochaetaceae bacterium]
MNNILEKEIQQFNSQHNRLSIAYETSETQIITLTLFLNGDLDTRNSYEFISLFEVIDELDHQPERIVVNCRNIDYISSTGVGSFTSILIKCRTKGIDFFLSQVPHKVTDVLALLGFLKHFPILDGTNNEMKDAD